MSSIQNEFSTNYVDHVLSSALLQLAITFPLKLDWLGVQFILFHPFL